MSDVIVINEELQQGKKETPLGFHWGRFDLRCIREAIACYGSGRSFDHHSGDITLYENLAFREFEPVELINKPELAKLMRTSKRFFKVNYKMPERLRRLSGAQCMIETGEYLLKIEKDFINRMVKEQARLNNLIFLASKEVSHLKIDNWHNKLMHHTYYNGWIHKPALSINGVEWLLVPGHYREQERFQEIALKNVEGVDRVHDFTVTKVYYNTSMIEVFVQSTKKAKGQIIYINLNTMQKLKTAEARAEIYRQTKNNRQKAA
ncbi:hypothetical protein [Piscirickettsia litoralis]|uniref:Uncharacterized protein n=1 Tax=Piscirickettsia litoralis TaxID=1891921 RepID=A0ABX2ZXT0_9GAMM|nr:hypothetical protein [Piscirickettsia litoralis]ODN41010.1 hypothetical protein BGC07_18435 [Piscirickettsia litoralis]